MSIETLRIAHISDPHFGTSTSEKITALSAALRDLKPDQVVLSGDITQRARKDQFLAAKKFCDSLHPLEVAVLPGNHDIPLYNVLARLFFPYLGFSRYLKMPTQFFKKKSSVEILGVNSTRPWRVIQGQLGMSGRSRLKKFNPESKVRIVVAHHPLDCPKHVDDKNILKDAQRSLLAMEHAKVDLVLGGHIHDPLARLSDVRYPQCHRPFIISLAGTCLSSRVRANAPNSFNLLEIKVENESAHLKISRFDLAADLTFYIRGHVDFQRHGRDQWVTVANES